MAKPKQSIAICGSGMAAQLTAIALAKSLPSYFRLTLINDTSTGNNDAFYGHVCAPTAYSFHLKLGLSEPDLMMLSDTGFSYGTQYQKWALQDLNWLQCFHLPLPIQDGVEFQHCLLRAGHSTLEPYLVSAQAALKGRFAHPPSDPNSALSRAEYGYQFSTDEYSSVLRKTAQRYHEPQLVRHNTKQIRVVHQNSEIDCLILDDERKIKADFYVDCTGPNANLLSKLSVKNNDPESNRTLSYLASKLNTRAPLTSARTVDSFEFGWQSNTPVRGHVERLTVFCGQDHAQAKTVHGESHEINDCLIGRRSKAWVGNCLAIGHAAAIIEPLTPAPHMLLQRDIERLLELIPVNRDMAIERTEYNRRFRLDYDHASLFNRALYCTDSLPNSTFWQEASKSPMDDKLKIKLTQFDNRGIVSMFDLEPFNSEDWLIQFFGMNRCVTQYNRFADRFPLNALKEWFAAQKNGIDALTNKMPSPDQYITRMLDYVRSQP